MLGLKLRLKPTKQSEDKKRFPCCGLPSNHTPTQLLGGSSVETKEAYQLSQINELLSRTLGVNLPYVSSQGYKVVPKSEALGGSGRGVCQVNQIKELLERTTVH